MKVVFTLANNSTAPYFNWFAERSAQEDDITFAFICLHSQRPKMIDDMAQWGCECHWLPFDHQKRKRGFASVTPKLIRLFKKLKPDVVHTHLFDDSLPSLAAARLTGVPVRAITKGDSAFHYHHARQWVRFDRLNNRNATHVVAISEQNKQFILEKERANPAKVSMIHHGIPIEKATAQSDEIKQELRQRFDLVGKTVIGTVSRFIEWKGHQHIIGAAPAIIEKHPDALFLFTGVGELEQQLKQQIKGKGLEAHFCFTGWVDPSHMPSLYGVMDLYLHAASFEPFGFVIVEAMANGLPVVSTRTGAAADAIEHGQSGYLAEQDNSEALATGVNEVLAQDHKAMGAKAAAKAAADFSFEHMWNNYINLYKRAL